MRVTNTLVANSLLGDIQRSQERLLVLQRQSASGRRILAPSDDPVGAVSSSRLQSALDRQAQYRGSVAVATSRLDATDAAMADVNEVMTQMKALILEMSDDTQDAASREAGASVVSAALESLLGIANRKLEGRSLFAGRKTDQTPFVSQGGGIVYQGDKGSVQAVIQEGQPIAMNLHGVEVFGAVTSQVAGIADLNPAATTATRLVDLNNGRGVRLGSVLVSDGVTSNTISLAGAESLGDVIDRLNTNTLGIAATITTTGGAAGQSRITLTKAGFTLSVAEVSGGYAAADLGIVNTGVLSPLNGTDLDPRLTAQTTVASLYNNTGGVSLTGLRIANGQNVGTVSFAGATAFQDILNALKSSGLHVDAEIDATGRRLNLLSKLNGAEFRVGENASTTGANLGVLSMHGATQLSTLNRGNGVNKAPVPTDDDFRITQRNGNLIDVNISAAATITDVITAINTDATNPGTLVASLSGSGGNGIVLTDASVGAFALSAVRLNGSLAARDLGIEKTAAAGTLTGDDVNPITTGSVFAVLTEFQTALLANDGRLIDQAGRELDTAFETLLQARATAGGRLQRLEMTDARLEQETEQTKGLLSETLDADLAEVLTRFNQEQLALQAALQVSARAFQLSLLDYL